MLEMVEGFSIVEFNQKVKANEMKFLNISFTQEGTGTCVYVDFGNGLKKIYSDNLGACNHYANFR